MNTHNHKVIIKLNDRVTNVGTFETREELDAWVEKHKQKGTFGDFHTYEYEDLTVTREQEAQKAEAIKFLQDTDYKVTKYRDQVEMGRTPDLTVEEYQYLLTQRQQARDKI